MEKRAIWHDKLGNRIRSTTDGMSTNFTYVRGNLLAGVDSNILYEYNKDGARFQKTVDGVATRYFLDGHRIMGENRGTDSIRYFYDIDGLCGIRYNGQNYNVVRDALGNVVAITQGAEIRARYEYDSLGNCKVYNLGNSTIGDVNPFRWKGHYFDTETGFYYIQGRYYDPQTGRFVQPANVSGLNPQVIHGLNLYSYSNNQIGVAYSSSSVSGGASCGTFASRVGNSKSIYHGTLSNSSNILSAIGSLSIAFGFFDQWSGYLSGGFDAGLSFLESEGFGFQFLGKYSSALKKFGVGMTIAGNVLSWGSSVYNNFTNPNYTPEEAIGASAMDAVYYTGKALGTYWLGSKVGKLAVTLGVAAGSAVLGTTVFGTTIGFVGALAIGGGVAVLVGIAGAVAIYFLGELLDEGWNWIKEQIFE